MTMGALARRYARAILELATEQNEVERLGRDLASFAQIWTDSADLQDLFTNPKVNTRGRREVVAALVERAGLSPLARNTLLYLSDQGRLAAIADIARGYASLAEDKAGTVRAEVTAAAELPESYFAQLSRALEAATGKKVIIERRVDPTLIAGVVTRVGDKVYDGSVRTQLEGLRDSLRPA